MRPTRASHPIAALIAVLTVIALSACTPTQLEIDLTVRQAGTITYRASPDGSVAKVTLSGVVACSGGTTSSNEPLDLFLTVVQGGTTFRAQVTDRCSAPRVWRRTFDILSTARLHPGPVSVGIQACTNPGELINEDCTIALNAVTLTFVP